MTTFVAEVLHIDEFTFHPAVLVAGCRRINVDKNGAPHAQIWTFVGRIGDIHPWHAKTLSGEYKAFYQAELGNLSALDCAMTFVRGF